MRQPTPWQRSTILTASKRGAKLGFFVVSTIGISPMLGVKSPIFRRMKLLPFFICCALLGLEATAQSNFKNICVDKGGYGSLGPCEPSICIDPSNPKIVVAGSVLNSVYYSKNGGKRWKKKTLTSSYGVFGDPVIGADMHGKFYYLHLSDPSGKGWSDPSLLDRIVIQQSDNGGKTWNDGNFMGLDSPKDQDKQWWTINPQSGDMYTTWTEFDLYNSNLPTDKSRIVFSKSTDGGVQWSEPITISDREGDCLDGDQTTEGAVPAVGPNGEIYVSWAYDNKLWFDRSLDGGTTWLNKDVFVAEQPGGWTFDIPGLGRANGLPFTVTDCSNGPNRGTIYVNWCDERNGNKDVWVAASSDLGSTWSDPVRVNDDEGTADQFFTAMDVDQSTGYLYCVFYDRRHQTKNSTDVFLAVSKDGGKTWENMRISEEPFHPVKGPFFGDYNDISAADGHVRPIWTRMDKGRLSVWTALIDF